MAWSQGSASTRQRRSFSHEAALPPYPGGKRWALPAIFGLVREICPPESWPRLAFCDAFLGGGSVALNAKALGFRLVLANDLALRSVIVGRALLANSSVTISHPDVLRLFHAGEAVSCGGVLLDRLPPAMASFLAGAWKQAALYNPPRDDLVRLLMVKWVLSFFPLGLPSATDAWRIRDGDLDAVTARRMNHYLARRRQLLHPSHLLKLAKDVNAGVFPGQAHVSQRDVFQFLPNVEADVVYLDPPYGGTQSYERAFRLLDEFIGDDRPPSSEFSSKRPPLDDLLDACRHIPVMVLSVGNALLDEAQARTLVSRHRRVLRVLSFPISHYQAVASAEKRTTNREFLVLGTLE